MTAVEMLVKVVTLAARSAGRARKRHLKELVEMSVDEKSKEIEFLRARVEELEAELGFWKSRAKRKSGKPHYSPKERLHVIFLMEMFQIPRRQVTEYFGVARSTLYRWLRKLDDASSMRLQPWNKTPDEITNYHKSRTHLSLDMDCPKSRPIQPPELGNVVEIPEVEGLHHRYERRAA